MQDKMNKHLLCNLTIGSLDTRQLAFDENSALIPIDNSGGNPVQILPRQGYLLFASRPNKEMGIRLTTIGVKRIHEDGSLTSVGDYQMRHALISVIRDLRDWLSFHEDTFTV